MATTNLDITTVVASQNQKEVTINDAFQALDNAITEDIAVDLSGGTATISDADFRNNIRFTCSGQVADTTLNVPAVKRLFVVSNTDATFEVDVTRGTTIIAIAVSSSQMLYTDGTANGLMKVADSAVGPPAQGDFILIDTAMAASTNNFDFTFDPTLYSELELTITNLVGVANGSAIALRVSDDNGTTFKEGVSDYAWASVQRASDDIDRSNADSADSEMHLFTNYSNDTTKGSYCKVTIANHEAGFATCISVVSTTFDSVGAVRTGFNGGMYLSSTNATNAIRILDLFDNILTGTFVLRGKLK